MLKLKNVIVVCVVAALVYACNKGSSPQDNFDHEAQSLIDNDSLIEFFKTHYFDDVIDSVKLITNGQTALIEDSRLNVKDVTEQGVDYKLYYFEQRVGTPDPIKESPYVVDSVLVKYRGEYLQNTEDLILFDEKIYPRWVTLDQVIRGWTHTFVEFKGGRKISKPDEPITFEEGGKGVIFIPSGLGYRNQGNSGIPPNANLMFYFDLFDIIENTNYDNDSIISKKEDVDGDGDPRNDNTDDDRLPNYRDPDDDGDGVLTRNEDANGDGDPTNDFSDPNNPTLPDYLNPNYPNNG